MKYFSLNYFSRSTLFSSLLIWILFWIWVSNILEDIFLCIIIFLFFLLLWIIICLQYRQIILLCLLLFLWGSIWIIIWFYNGQNISTNLDIIDSSYWLYSTYTWEVIKVHRRTDYYDEYLIDLDRFEDVLIQQKLLYVLRVPKNFTLQPKQIVSHQWVMYKIEDFDGFAYKKFMLSQWIYFSTSATNIIHLSHNQENIWFQMFLYRERLLSRISDIFPSREAIFLWWILFWARENIPQDLKEDFNNSWLTHFIAVSWFNITLCIIFMSYIFWFLPVFIRSTLVIISIVAFSFFVWLWAPVVRAAIMWTLWYIFLQSGNTSNTTTLVIFTAVIMSIMSPLSLNYDVSLHLSFLAVIWIMYTQELFTKLFYFMPSTFAIREAFVLTLSALSFSLPIMMFQFGQVSLLAPLANIAVTWTIPLAMLGWAITLIVDYFSPLLWEFIWYLTWILLRYDIAMVEFFWNIDAALLRLDFWMYSLYLQVLYFMLLTYILLLLHFQKKNQL